MAEKRGGASGLQLSGEMKTDLRSGMMQGDELSHGMNCGRFLGLTVVQIDVIDRNAVYLRELTAGGQQRIEYGAR